MTENRYKTCPECGEKNKSAAVKCGYCYATIAEPAYKALLNPLIKGISGQYAGKTIELIDEKLVIGRDPSQANLVYPQSSDKISRKHVTIYFDNNTQRFILEDFSSNGTFLFPKKKLESGKSYFLNAGERFYITDPNETFEVFIGEFGESGRFKNNKHNYMVEADGIKHNKKVIGSKEVGLLVPELISLMGGIISAVVLVYPLTYILGFLGIFFAPIVEEICKVVGVIFLAIWYPKTTSTKKKGLILGGMAGLGFAFTENMFYILRIEMTIYYAHFAGMFAFLRIVPLVGHIICSALVGIGLVSFSQKVNYRGSINLSELFLNAKKSFLFPLLTIAIVLHLAFNILASFLGIYGIFTGLGIQLLIFIKIYKYLPNHFDNMESLNSKQLLSEAVFSRPGK